MTHNEAIDFLKTYDCVCPYGTHPNPQSCGDKECKLYEAINSLEPDISKFDCEGCKHENKKGRDYPCNVCKNNHVNMFEWRADHEQ